MFGEYPIKENSTATMPRASWSGFYKKPLKERQTQLKLAFPDLFTSTTSNSSSVVSSVYVTPATSPTSPSFSHNVCDSTDNKTTDQHHNFDHSSLISKLNSLTVANEHTEAFPIGGLDEDIADHMIENCIGYLITLVITILI
jgi:hydroxymethylglutaryl-CoA reductase